MSFSAIRATDFEIISGSEHQVLITVLPSRELLNTTEGPQQF